MNTFILLICIILGGSFLLADARPLPSATSIEPSDGLQPSKATKKIHEEAKFFILVTTVSGSAACFLWLIIAFFLAEWYSQRGPNTNRGMLYCGNGRTWYHMV